MVAKAEARQTRKQRGRHEGSIRLRADGRWEARVSLPDGKRRSKFAKTKAEAQRALTAMLNDVQNGLPMPNARLTVEAFLNDWLENTVKVSTRPRTYQSYELTARLHINPALGKVRLVELTPARIQALLNTKREQGLSARSITYIRDVLSRALNQAVRWNMLPRNPAPLVPAPKGAKKEIRVLAPEEARQFLDAVRGDRLEALYTVALALGLRRGEALGLQWGDISLDAGTITVRRQLQRIGGELRLTEPKSRESRRTVFLPPVVVEALRQHRVRQLEERLASGGEWQDSGFVFTTFKGTPVDERNLLRFFDAAVQRAGLPPMRFHDLRHSAASLLLAQGVSAKMVQEMLGHSNITLTLGTYSHIIPQLARDTANRMNAVLTGAATG